MPGYRKSSKYSSEKNGEIRSRLIDVLNNNQESMSMKEMQAQDMILNSLTTQKMARELNYLVDMGVVQKAQSRLKKSMVYKATAHLDKETDYFDY
jgi:uncharacterized protein YejL (UPF0352 family)